MADQKSDPQNDAPAPREPASAPQEPLPLRPDPQLVREREANDTGTPIRVVSEDTQLSEERRDPPDEPSAEPLPSQPDLDLIKIIEESDDSHSRNVIEDGHDG